MWFSFAYSHDTHNRIITLRKSSKGWVPVSRHKAEQLAKEGLATCIGWL